MLALDADLTARKLAIPARPMIAAIEAATDDQGTSSGRLRFTKDEPTPGVYRGEDLTIRIARWYENRYGDRLRVDMSLGSSVVMLQGELWRYSFPASAGPVLLYARDLDVGPAMYLTQAGPVWLPPHHPDRRASKWTPLDVMRGVDGLPNAIIPLLSEKELQSVLELFYLDWQSLGHLTKARHYPMVRSALGDYRAAVQHLLTNPPELGLARWASQQGVEKLAKSFLLHATGSYPSKGPKAHDLSTLIRLTVEHGGFDLPDEIVARFACKPGVRYGDEDPGSVEAVLDAFRISLCFSGGFAVLLMDKFPRKPTPQPGSPESKWEWAYELMELMNERSGSPTKIEGYGSSGTP